VPVRFREYGRTDREEAKDPMSAISHQLRCMVLGAATLLVACATPGGGEPAPAPEKSATPAASGDNGNDPIEGFNRTMYAFNDTVDVYVLKPVAKAYREVLPSPVRTGVSNFFGNLHDPVIMLNNLLQGKVVNAISDLGRFIVNTVVGIYGLFDVASEVGLEKHNEDFGQTLGKWGAGEGFYVVLPFLGPSSLRDGTGIYVDEQVYPPNHMEEGSTRDKLLLLEVVNKRAQLLDASDILEQAGGQDPYVFVREAYRQRRKSLVFDGNPPMEQPDSILFEDDKPAPKSGTKPPAR